MVKGIRALNDNSASIVYNYTKSLPFYFWIGFCLTVVSFMSSWFLMTIHESVMQQHYKKKDFKSQQDHKYKAELKENSLSVDYKWLCLIYSLGFSTIHSFYPNMSNFLQQRFGFNNEEAGHILSLPFILASFATPLFGTCVSRLGSTWFESLISLSACLILVVHTSLCLMPDSLPGEGKNMLVLLPIALFGLSHAMFVTMHGPCVK